MSKKLIVGTLAVLIIGGSLFCLLYKPQSKAGQLAMDVNEAVGERAAEEVAQLLGGHGLIGVVGMPTTSGQNSPWERQMVVFYQTLKERGIKIAATKTVSADVSMMMPPVLSAKEYADLLAQVAGAGAIVSFVGVPSLGVEDLKKLQAQGVRLVVVKSIDGGSPGTVPDLTALVEAKAVAIAFVARTGAEMAQAKSQPKIFDRYYKVLYAD